MNKGLAQQKDAFIQLINQHQRVIHKVCSMYTHADQAHEDLFQEVMLQLWKAYPSFRHESKVSTWIYKVALHTALTALRKTKRKDKLRAENEYTFQQLQQTEDTEKADRLATLEQAIKSLHAGERAIVLLYLEEKSYKEMAEILGISESNVGVRINRIKKKLKSIVIS